MSRAATWIRNGVHPRRIVELYMGYNDVSGELQADWQKPPPSPTGYIDTLGPKKKGARVYERHPANPAIDQMGKKFGIWYPFQAMGPRNTLLFAIKNKPLSPKVQEMDSRAAEVLAGPRGPLHVLRPKPTMIVVMPSTSEHALHFAQELGKRLSLPVRSDVLAKRPGAEVKGKIAAQKLEWTRKAYRVVNREGIEGASIILADDNVGTGFSMSACAEALYQTGATNVHGVAVFSVSGGKKDPEIPDVSLSFAKGIRGEPEPMDAPEWEPNETEQEQTEIDAVPKRNERNVAKTFRDSMLQNAQSLGLYTVKDYAEMYELSETEIRFALAQLGLLGRVKPG